ncbi:MAG TPA: SOS response-associated peptidase [Streptosporangiaceae bacterium]|nr:SOS response-associated peptidase [Streptosporangiaceae bacterium]
MAAGAGLDDAGAGGGDLAGTRARGAGTGGAERELRVVRWGLVPSWAKDISIGSRMINARAETVSEKPAFRAAFARRRCLLPADGYYEWQQPPAGTRGPKQPYFICRPDHGPLAFAGLYELWRDRSLPRDDPDAWLWTAAIITTTAPDELGEIHDRMPMVIDPAYWADWLDPANIDAGDVRALLTPAAASGLTSYPVSLAVNSVRNNGPELIAAADPVSHADADRPGGARSGGAGAGSAGPGSAGPGSAGPGSAGPESVSPGAATSGAATSGTAASGTAASGTAASGTAASDTLWPDTLWPETADTGAAEPEEAETGPAGNGARESGDARTTTAKTTTAKTKAAGTGGHADGYGT